MVHSAGGQSISQTVDQSDSGSVREWTSRSIDHSESGPVDQSIIQRVDQSDSRSVGQSISRSVDQFVYQFVNQFFLFSRWFSLIFFCSQFGFTNFLSDLFDAPEPVMRYLYESYHLYNIPIARDDSTQHVNQVSYLKPFSHLYAQRQNISGV